MKTETSITLLLLSIALGGAASETFRLGGEDFTLEFPNEGYSEAFRSFVAEDVERVFTPLGNITNIADVTVFATNSSASVPLIHYEWYPEQFFGGIAVSNGNEGVLFKMNATLSEKYRSTFDSFETISNQFAQLSALICSIQDNSITNRSDAEIVSLLFIPTGSTATASPHDARAFFQELHELDSLTISVLDFWEESVQGQTCLMAGAKTTVRDGTELRFAPILWIYRNESWQFYHPAIMETIP